MKQKLEEIKSFSNIKKKPHKNVHKFVNTYNVENPKKYKRQIREQRIQILNTNVKRVKKDREETKEGGSKPFISYHNSSKKPMVLHNFRKNRV